MSEPGGPKKPPIYKNQIQIQINEEFSFASSFSFFLSSSLCPPGKDKDIKMEESTEQLFIKRECSQSFFRKKN